MAFLDLFKKKKTSAKGGPALGGKKKEKPKEIKEEKLSKVVQEDKEGKAGPSEKAVLGDNAFSYKIIKSPHVSEKASNVSVGGQYIFKVANVANKIEIKKAVKKLYKVDVEGVNIIYIPSKKRQVGRHRGKKSGYKKAVVTLKKGQTIEIAPT